MRDKLLSRLLTMAIADHAAYWQYDGYFTGWILAESQVDCRYRGGSSLSVGRWVLASPDLLSWYDPDNGNICGVAKGDNHLLAI